MTIYKNSRSKHTNPYTPFYYVIGWTTHDRWYVGSRTANRKGYKAHPDELMTTYFTSSDRYVWPFIEQHGLPDVVWTFPCKTREEALQHEARIMDEFHNFLPDDRWLNKNSNGMFSMDQEIREKISLSHKGVSKSPSHRSNISIGMKGKQKSDEHRANLRNPKSKETKDKISASLKGRIAWNKGKNWSEDSKEKMSKARKEYYEIKRGESHINKLC